jgi:hypothetical protein
MTIKTAVTLLASFAMLILGKKQRYEAPQRRLISAGTWLTTAKVNPARANKAT